MMADAYACVVAHQRRHPPRGNEQHAPTEVGDAFMVLFPLVKPLSTEWIASEHMAGARKGKAENRSVALGGVILTSGRCSRKRAELGTRIIVVIDVDRCSQDDRSQVGGTEPFCLSISLPVWCHEFRAAHR